MTSKKACKHSVERKVFAVDFSKEKNSRFVVLTEKNHAMFLEMVLERSLIIWLVDLLDDLLIILLNQKFRGKTLCENGFIWV